MQLAGEMPARVARDGRPGAGAFSADPIVGVRDGSTTVKGVVQLASSADTAANLVVQSNDTRLTDARTPVAGEVPNPLDPPKGCAFNPRCTVHGARCLVERPELMAAGANRAACWRHDPGGVGQPISKEMADA